MTPKPAVLLRYQLILLRFPGTSEVFLQTCVLIEADRCVALLRERTITHAALSDLAVPYLLSVN